MAPPDWAVRLAQHGTGIVFFDELFSAPPAVQAALLRVVLERHVGSLRLPERVRIVAAANPPASAADGWHLSPPLANRFVHLHWNRVPWPVARGPRTVARGIIATRRTKNPLTTMVRLLVSTNRYKRQMMRLHPAQIRMPPETQ